MPKKTNYFGAICATNIGPLRKLSERAGNAIIAMPVKSGTLKQIKKSLQKDQS